MKKLLLLFTIILFALTIKAQVGTDLQFSQIVTLKGEFLNPTNAHKTVIGTVPSGKIWKILGGGAESSRSTNHGGGNITYSHALAPKIIQDPNTQTSFMISDPSPTGADYIYLFPGNYLNENTDVYAYSAVTGGHINRRYIFQAIEYTVVP